MIFDKINISKELKKERNRTAVLTDAKQLLSDAAENDENILARLKTSSGEITDAIPENIDPDNVFTLEEIGNICIAYRLRFLDSKYFKTEFPNEAISRINEFEKRYHTKIKRFKIIAPDKAFELVDCNQDPLLFAPLDNDRFYLIHQWGNDLAWYRKYLYFPVRSIYTYFYFILAVAAIFAFSVPFEWFQVKPDNIMYMRMWFTVHCFIGIFFIVIFLGSIMQTGFSSMIWKSKYMNE